MVTTGSEMTYIVSSGALNSTHSPVYLLSRWPPHASSWEASYGRNGRRF